MLHKALRVLGQTQFWGCCDRFAHRAHVNVQLQVFDGLKVQFDFEAGGAVLVHLE